MNPVAVVGFHGHPTADPRPVHFVDANGKLLTVQLTEVPEPMLQRLYGVTIGNTGISL